MSEYRIQLEWKRETEDFDYSSFNRDHSIIFGNNSRICASAAPEYLGNPDCLNPEQAFISAMVSCHMLTFLALASRKRYVVDSYHDSPFGVLGKNETNKPAIVKVVMTPHVVFSGENVPSEEEYKALHDKAHDFCFISNSVAECVKLTIEPEFEISR
jgi:organic hydroperoxide reductase OsmC/OhrA